MKVAALYDVHGMPWALEAVLAEVDADAIVFGGDLTGGPYPEETLALARSVEAVWIRGNTEDESIPLTAELDGVVYCHATPTSNRPPTTEITPESLVREQFPAAGTYVIGHTHHQFEREFGDLRVINAGSVGMAYEGDVAAYWTLVEDGEPRFRRTAFDVAQAVVRVRASAWPERDAFVAENLLVAVDRAEAIAFLEEHRR
jgi:predicted phosphodiesterase